MEAAYYGVYLWAAAVQRAGSERSQSRPARAQRTKFSLGNVRVRVDPSNQHIWKIFEIGQVRSDNKIDVIKTGDAPIPPPSRGRARMQVAELRRRAVRKMGRQLGQSGKAQTEEIKEVARGGLAVSRTQQVEAAMSLPQVEVDAHHAPGPGRGGDCAVGS